MKEHYMPPTIDGRLLALDDRIDVRVDVAIPQPELVDKIGPRL